MMQQKMYELLGKARHKLTRQQFQTLKGQIKSGDIEGAYKGLLKILERQSEEYIQKRR